MGIGGLSASLPFRCKCGAEVTSPHCDICGDTNAPVALTGSEGDVKFVRSDAGSRVSALAYLLKCEGENWSQSEAVEVEMLPVPDHFIEVDETWWVVRKGTPGAVKYWRFSA